MMFDRERVLLDEVGRELVDYGFRIFDMAPDTALADTVESCIGLDPDKEKLACVDRFDFCDFRCCLY
jgi:hypothetical protein